MCVMQTTIAPYPRGEQRRRKHKMIFIEVNAKFYIQFTTQYRSFMDDFASPDSVVIHLYIK
jgi:hypothetical protein